MAMDRTGPFRIPTSSSEGPSDPEALFRDLRNRDPRIQHLWSHQADMLRSYTGIHQSAADIALELPTGSGKTLIGLLIGEFRRLSSGERVAYLCPTRQLAHQVHTRAAEYGISASLLVGKQAEYDQTAYWSYVTGKSIAVTTYSAVFNTNPKINDAQVLILDDAHAGENYVSSYWSLEINRLEQPDLFRSLVHLWSTGLPEQFMEDLEQSSYTPSLGNLVSIVPYPVVLDRLEQVRQTIDEAQRTDGLGDAAYRWDVVRSHLTACQAFVTWNTVTIRPVVPPTSTHAAFDGAKQRVFMSATMGSDGDLERVFGRQSMHRIPVPPGWDRQGSGRRLVLFPDVSLDEQASWELISHCVKKYGRCLALCPDRSTAEVFGQTMSDMTGVPILGATDIEQSLSPFTDRNTAVLALAGRYDGIDLPDEMCRLLVVYGLPAATNVQEKFLLSRVKATSLLVDRIRTRLTQATGRCTRGSTDYALVLLMGPKIADFCAKSEVKAGFHPELRAEIGFGLENSVGISDISAFRDMISAFDPQSEGWAGAEQAIIQMRNTNGSPENPDRGRLLQCARHEVKYAEAMWGGDYGSALEQSRSAADLLGGADMAPYRAWWHYLAGSAAWASYSLDKEQNHLNVAHEQWDRACSTNTTITWLRDLRRAARLTDGSPAQWSDEDVRAAERVAAELGSLGFSGTKFQKSITEFLAQLDQDEPSAFEKGIQRLGSLLGFESPSLTINAEPDAVWMLDPHMRVVVEAKSNETSDGAVSFASVREATTHLTWGCGPGEQPGVEHLVCLLVGQREVLATEAERIADNVAYLTVGDIRDIGRKCVDALRTIRAGSAQSDSAAINETVLEVYSRQMLLPGQLREMLQSKALLALPRE